MPIQPAPLLRVTQTRSCTQQSPHMSSRGQPVPQHHGFPSQAHLPRGWEAGTWHPLSEPRGNSERPLGSHATLFPTRAMEELAIGVFKTPAASNIRVRFSVRRKGLLACQGTDFPGSAQKFCATIYRIADLF